MSYADAASKGPKQSPEELNPLAPPSVKLPISNIKHPDRLLTPRDLRRAPQPPQVTTDSSTSSIVNVDSQDLKSAASDAASTADQKAGEAKEKAGQESQTLKQKASEAADSAEKNFEKGKGKAKDGAKSAEKEIKGEYNEVYENRDNPVIIGNAVAIALGAAGLGYGAYTKHVKGELNWQVAGIAAAGVAVFGVADYYLSQYLFENKYPKRSGKKF